MGILGNLRAGSYTTMALVAGAAEDASYPDSLAALREYHGSLSGVLKNALDLMGFKEFEGKLIGLWASPAAKLVFSTRSIVYGMSGKPCAHG